MSICENFVEAGYKVLIETLWNVNCTWKLTPDEVVEGFNRNIVECK